MGSLLLTSPASLQLVDLVENDDDGLKVETLVTQNAVDDCSAVAKVGPGHLGEITDLRRLPYSP